MIELKLKLHIYIEREREIFELISRIGLIVESAHLISIEQVDPLKT